MPQFTPLPLSARNVLELIDTSLKVYKQYFLVLLGWSALLHLVSLGVARLPGVGGLLAFSLTPLQIAVAACSVAAAVRGQDVSFGQCWEFAKARYPGMIG